MIRELISHEFTERLLPLFRDLEQQAYGRAAWRPEHFFPAWQEMMRQRLARTWELPEGAVLGAVFVPDIFRATTTGLVVFWASTPEGRRAGKALELFRAFERAAQEEGCERICAAAHKNMNADRMRKLFKRRGFFEMETTFCKNLV